MAGDDYKKIETLETLVYVLRNTMTIQESSSKEELVAFGKDIGDF